MAIAPVAIDGATSARSPSVTRGEYINAYAECNNSVWRAFSYRLIRLDRSGTERAKRYPFLQSFAELGLSLEPITRLQPAQTATVGWSLATKSYADHGGIERRFMDRSAALSMLKRFTHRKLDTLRTDELAALASDADVVTRIHQPVRPLAAYFDAASPSAPLSGTLAAATLRWIGTHEDVGSTRVVPHAAAECAPALRARLVVP